MQLRPLHRFQIGDRRYVIDTNACFCFECDHISWDVLEYYPEEPVSRILSLLRDKHSQKELEEVVGELEWLRVTRAILSAPKDEELLEQASAPGSLEHMTVTTGPADKPFAPVVAAAGMTLLAGSGAHNELKLLLAFQEARCDHIEAVAETLLTLDRAVRSAGKRLDIIIEIPLSGSVPGDHQCYVQATLAGDADTAGAISHILKAASVKPGKVAAMLLQDGVSSHIAVRACPVSPHFGGLVKTLHGLGFQDITLDIPGLYASVPEIPPEPVAEALRENASWYAGRLLHGTHIRVEPMASLFAAIHEGKPIRRADPAGTRSLAVDGAGHLYPSFHFVGNQRMQAGNVLDGAREAGLLAQFAEMGALQTPVCLRCWANCLCGGGYAAIHMARSGNIRSPEPAWCDTQRNWCAHVVAIFNRLASEGINFSHIEMAMSPHSGKISWLAAAKALFTMRLRARPLAEKDAEWLVRWEKWNPAAYFLCNESGLLLTTQYDREMDALHPRGAEQEFVLTRPDGRPCGLLRIRPEGANGLAWAWLYLRDKREYAEAGIRRTLRNLLKETAHSQQLRRVLIPVTTAETELAGCLEAIGFVCAGTQRQALYLHGAYQDVRLYLRG